MRHYVKLLRAMLTALMLVVMARAAIAGPWEDAVAAHGRGDQQPHCGFFARWLIKALPKRGAARGPILRRPRRAAGLRRGREVVSAGCGARRRQRAVRSRFDVSQQPRLPQDYAAGREWFPPLAVLSGHGDAEYILGTMYANGQGVPQDYAEAVKWFRLAAERGDADAQYALGLMYQSGHGVSQDYTLSHMWFDLLAARGSKMQ